MRRKNTKFTEERELEIIKLYTKELLTKVELGKIFNCPHAAIDKILLKLNIPKRKNTDRDRFLNHNYFQNLDTEAKVYFAAFIIGDGNIYKATDQRIINNWKANICIELQEQDGYILEIFKQELNSKNRVRTKPIRKGSNLHCAFKVSSDKIAEDLFKIGITAKKSLTINIDNILDFIPKEFLGAFIRGLVDSDGCIQLKYHEKSKKVIRSFDIAGSISVCSMAKKILCQELNLSNESVRIYKQGNIYRLKVSQCLALFKIRDFLYKDARVFLTRKKEIFDKLDEFGPIRLKSCRP